MHAEVPGKTLCCVRRPRQVTETYPDTQECEIRCPWCWEVQHILVDCSQGSSRIIEDCSICCHPMELVISLELGETFVHVEREQ